MKVLLASLLLLFSLAAHAQEPEARPSSQRYGWFHNEQWAREVMMGQPGWRLQKRGEDAGGWQFVLFSDTHYTRAVNYRFMQGRIGGVSYLFFNDNPEGRVWRTADMEKVGENEWIDRKSNARVKRRYNDGIIAYDVQYEPFTTD